MQKLTVTLLIVFCSYRSYSQNISGTWLGSYKKGKLSTNITELKFDIELYNDSLIKGTRVQYYDAGKFESFTISGVFYAADSTINIIEEAQIAQNADGFGDKGSYRMKLQTREGIMRFEGKWKNSSQSIFTSMSSKVWIEKPVKSTLDTTEAHVLPIKIDKQALLRKTKMLRSIEISDIEKDSIRIEIFDHVLIDNDVVSIYINDTAIAYRQTLSAEPIIWYMHMNKQSRDCLIKVVAESYGNEPPCTARINKITTKKNVYMIDTESNYDSNGTIIISLK